MPEERKIKHVVQVYQTPLYKSTVKTALRFGLERKQYAQMLLENCQYDHKFDHPSLISAFSWNHTEQGHDYWEALYYERAPMAI